MTTRPARLGRRGLLGGAVALAASQSACSPDGSSTPVTARPDVTPSSGTQPSASADGGPPATILLAYFSRAGENYYYGDRIDLEVGNTEVLARIMSRRLTEQGVAHDVHRIEAAEPYSDSYDDTVARNVREQDSDARPGIANPLPSIDGYDTVLLGSPIWNVQPPMIMRTFAETYDFTGRTVHPFTTHAMSGLGRAERDYTEFCRGATIAEGLAVQGEEVREAGPEAAAEWLTGIIGGRG